MSGALADQLALLPEYLSKHLLLTVVALSVGVGISLPVGLLATRARWLRGPVLGVASAVQTVPSLALLALMVPLLGAIGFVPAVVALTLYSMLPVLRNTVTGVEGVDPDAVEAGRGLGMTDLQLLLRIELPLAGPVILAGVRTSTVWVVGIATLSTPVGATSLGNYIFSGLQTQNYTAVVVGCIASAALALVLDTLIRVGEVAVRRRSVGLTVAAAGAVALVVGLGLAPAMVGALRGDGRTGLTVGAKTFTEQYILAALVEDRLSEAGLRTRRLDSLGSTVVFDALAQGRIDVYIDYTGTIWSNYMKRDEPAAADETYRAVAEWLERTHGIVAAGRLGFENTYALAMPRDEAERLGISSIGDLVPHASELTVAGDYELFSRPEWRRVMRAYNLSFGRAVSMDSSLMYDAIGTESIDVIAAFSTDGRILANDLVVLDDPRGAFPPYDAVLLLSPSLDGDRLEAVERALGPMVSGIDDALMRRANKLVDVDGVTPEAAAEVIDRELEGSSAAW